MLSPTFLSATPLVDYTRTRYARHRLLPPLAEQPRLHRVGRGSINATRNGGQAASAPPLARNGPQLPRLRRMT